jgi:hypothetical protein
LYTHETLKVDNIPFGKNRVFGALGVFGDLVLSRRKREADFVHFVVGRY